MKAIIKEIITHFLVVCVVLIVAYGNHDKRAFNMSNEVKNVLVAGDPNMISFNEVSWIYSFSFSSSMLQGEQGRSLSESAGNLRFAN